MKNLSGALGSTQPQAATTLMDNPAFTAKITDLTNNLSAGNPKRDEEKDIKDEAKIKMGDTITAKDTAGNSVEGKISKINKEVVYIVNKEDKKSY